MRPSVVWTFRAERRLHFLLCQLRTKEFLTGTLEFLGHQLRLAFPGAESVVVLDLYLGFRARAGEYTLLADVRYPAEGEGGTVVVKLAPDARLRTESEAWANTRERQSNGDAVLMRQSALYHPQHAHRLIAVVYRDAAPHIGLDRQMSLEEAFLGAVRFGYPTVASVQRVFETLFLHLERELYSGAAAAPGFDARMQLNPSNGDGGARRSLREVLDGTPRHPGWAAPSAAAVLRHVDTAVGHVDTAVGSAGRGPGVGPRLFISPRNFFTRLAAREFGANPPRPRFAFPLTRGPAHGDLHGRNVIVGVSDADADRPAVFDYEHMNPDNLVGLDFAKLETELKVRAYRYAFPFDQSFPALPHPDHIRGVQGFEEQLARLDPAYVRPAGPAPRPEQERLFALLGGLRRQAARHLGKRSANPEHWEREYLLLLAAYGMYTVRFEQQTPPERAAAVVSAGVAAARLVTLV